MKTRTSKNLGLMAARKRHGGGPLGFLSMFALSATTLSGYGVITQSKEIDTVCKSMR